MSISDLRVGFAALTPRERNLFIIRFLHFFLFNTCQFPDFLLLGDETRRDNIEGILASHGSSIRRQLKSFLESLSSVEKQLRCLSSMPVEQVLFILGPNVHRPSRVVLLNFQNCDIDTSEMEVESEIECEERFPVFFRNLMQCPHYKAIFGGSLPAYRLHVYIKAKTKSGYCFGDCIPKIDFKPPSKGVHVINVLSMEDTMELSSLSECEGTAGGDASSVNLSTSDADITHRIGRFIATHDDEMWFACSKVIPGCQC